MKITGLGMSELEFLWELIREKYPNINTFIVSEKSRSRFRFITATKLIEFRNKQDAPLLVLIPSNSRTAAEDSYGNATFKEISLEGIEHKLKEELLNSVPSEFTHIVKNEILGYLDILHGDAVYVIDYLLSLEEQGYNAETIGNNIYLLDLIPDNTLIKEHDKIRSRLNFNLESISLLGSFHHFHIINYVARFSVIIKNKRNECIILCTGCCCD